jgi:3-oxoacyl-[acyl-carrier-protein] synthase-3
LSISILGTGSYLPEKIMTNADFEKFLDTSDEWITTRTGIKQRHYANGMTNCQMSVIAANRALDDAGLTINDIGTIIVASVTNEMDVPSIASQVQREMGANSCAAFDINAACTGFMYGLKAAAGFVIQDKKPVLVIGTEVLSRFMDWNDRSTCILFADGSGAAVVGPGESLKYIEVYAHPDVNHSLEIPGINNGLEEGESRFSYVSMDGKEIYKFATRQMPQDVEKAMEALDLKPEDIDWVIPHQANVRIIKEASKRLQIPLEKFYVNIQDVGNTSAASIPIVLDEMNKKNLLKKGDTVVVAGFGGGLTSACAVLKW